MLELHDDTLRDLRLTTRKAEKRPASDTISAVGSLELDPNNVSAVSTPLACRIVSISTSSGQHVNADDVLVEVESIEIARAHAASEAARTRVSIGANRLALADEQRERVRALVQERMSTVRDLQAAEADAAARKADVAEADAAVRDAERNLALLAIDKPSPTGRFTLRAGSSGVVTYRDGSVGEAVEPGHVFFRIAKTTPLHAVVHPFERDGARIDAGSAVRLTVPAYPGREFTASFIRSGPCVEAASRTLPVRLLVANDDGALMPGMSAAAEIRLGSMSNQEVVAVPIAAVQRVDRDWCVFLPLGAGRFERRAIARGRDLGGEVEVLSGLSAGEEIVVEGAFVLRSESTRGADTGDVHDH